MPLNCRPPTLSLAALEAKRRAVEGRSLVDYAHWGGLTADALDELAALHAAGVVGFKAFMCDSGLAEFPPVDDATLREGMRRVARLGGVVALHAESQAETARLGAAARAAGRRDPRAWARSRPPETEVEAVRRALALAEATSARVHFVHTSVPEAVGLVAAARARGVAASVETCPHYLALDEDDLERLGPPAKCAPPLRPRALVERLWDDVMQGRVDYVASDHSPCPTADKERGNDDIWLAWGGISGVQTLLPVLLDEGVRKRGLGLPRLVTLVAAEPARRYRLYPRKGALRVGSDGDLAVVDTERRWTLERGRLRTRWPLSPFVGRAFHGAVVATVVRGTVVYREGELLAEPGHGRLVGPAA
jgi:allantoinase